MPPLTWPIYASRLLLAIDSRTSSWRHTLPLVLLEKWSMLYRIHAWYLRKIQVPLPDRRYNESQATRSQEAERLGVVQTARNQETRTNVGRVGEKERRERAGWRGKRKRRSSSTEIVFIAKYKIL
ncbi:hypothetical protein R3P38DRAFT_2768527 [Favolaschia claudopus]|uniref:Uncharacterized protein n=1 Tax=Favolaschia claudopus TaxID=2862362 RepID=A0AAW0CQR2_9AGAR